MNYAGFCLRAGKMAPYWHEWLLIATMHLLAIISPGPDLLLVLQHSLTYRRPRVYYTCFGIGVAIFCHGVFAITGLSFIITRYHALYRILQYGGAIFLLYLAYGTWRASRAPLQGIHLSDPTIAAAPNWRLFCSGFLTNALNIKALVFFFTLFGITVDATTPFLIKGLYSVYLACVTVLIFIALSWLITQPHALRVLAACEHWIMRCASLMFAVFALALIFIVS